MPPAGLLLVLIVLVRRSLALRAEVRAASASRDPWAPIPVPPVENWVAANDDGSCPPAHPIKAKASSHLYHLPGMFAYDRTRPDRCYADGAAAVADGFTRAKR